ncbi:MAG: site-specific DNA-methyltransferase [Actinobacteria bacterium]|nr:site-specific DNA-methyltransferase [Actinomycetota bacterium]
MHVEVRLGDCLDIARTLPSGSARLIYLDPPFLTQKTHTLRSRDRAREYSFDDLWASHEDYARFLYERLGEVYRVLADNGSIFFHCDRRASHIARALLDKILGEENFRSEVIWYYRRWSNSQRALLPAHQTLYFYSKTERYIFNTSYGEYSPSTNVDQILQRRRRDKHGKATYDRDDSGNVVTGAPKKGVPLCDVWDIPFLNPKAKERTGYPTQKPVLLLERIIKLVTNPGDLVLDPFCGSGTTLVAAHLTGRNAIGIDTSEAAVGLTKQRLANPEKTESPLLESGRESYRTVENGALALLSGLDCVPVQRNNGIDAILAQNFRGRPVPIRVQRSYESVLEAAAALAAAGRTKHAALMFLVTTHQGGDLPFGQTLPEGLVTVECPALQIREALERAQADEDESLVRRKADA